MSDETTGYPLTCDEMHAVLTQAVVNEASAGPWQEAQDHLAACPRCASALGELGEAILEMHALEQVTATWQEADPMREFVPATTITEPLFTWDRIGRLVILLSEGVLRGWQAPAAETAGLKSGSRPRPRQVLSLRDELQEDDLEVTISVAPRSADADQADVIVEVLIPSLQGWPNLEGSTVTLSILGRPSTRQVTDAFGKAVFSGIRREDLPRAVFEIQPLDGR
jgi:hypothetical protein